MRHTPGVVHVPEHDGVSRPRPVAAPTVTVTPTVSATRTVVATPRPVATRRPVATPRPVSTPPPVATRPPVAARPSPAATAEGTPATGLEATVPGPVVVVPAPSLGLGLDLGLDLGLGLGSALGGCPRQCVPAGNTGVVGPIAQTAGAVSPCTSTLVASPCAQSVDDGAVSPCASTLVASPCAQSVDDYVRAAVIAVLETGTHMGCRPVIAASAAASAAVATPRRACASQTIMPLLWPRSAVAQTEAAPTP
ncbi:hypothetical protein GCM10009530_41960 [Microbispora corallina]|uniref:Uncharacterized protein n=1 Tax=Microbispora corallina TaxID=83302 RepID=A0ABQ4G1D6_9ACTN|nr:hypothetical protein Mco01_38750 [Microbispora corallina]